MMLIFYGESLILLISYTSNSHAIPPPREISLWHNTFNVTKKEIPQLEGYIISLDNTFWDIKKWYNWTKMATFEASISILAYIAG